MGESENESCLETAVFTSPSFILQQMPSGYAITPDSDEQVYTTNTHETCDHYGWRNLIYKREILVFDSVSRHSRPNEKQDLYRVLDGDAVGSSGKERRRYRK